MKKLVKRAIAAIVCAAALIWLVDWLVLWRRVSTGQDSAFGSVLVRRSYAVHLRNKRIEQDIAKPSIEECVQSIFPHYEESPCWYLRRHANRSEELDGGPWH